MGLIGIEKVNNENNSYIDKEVSQNVHKPKNMLDELDKKILEKKAIEDAKQANIAEAIKVQETIKEQKKIDEEAQKRVEEEYVKSLDPLNNASNPFPVNPVAPKEDKLKKESLGIGTLIKMIFGMVFHPGKVLEEKPEKYGTLGNGIKLIILLTIFTLLFSLITRVGTGMFVKDYNSITGSYTTDFNINNVLLLDYAYYLITAVVISGVAILIVSLIYYISSFINNKGVSFGEYVIITGTSFIPLLVGFSLLLPLGCLFKDIIGYVLLGISIIYTLVCFISGINQALTFSSVNRKIIYNTINLSLIFLAIVAVVYYVYFSGVFVIATNIRV